MRKKLALSAALLVAFGLMVTATAGPAVGDPKPGRAGKAQTTKIQILGLNDFHGALEPPGGSGGRMGATTTRLQ